MQGACVETTCSGAYSQAKPTRPRIVIVTWRCCSYSCSCHCGPQWRAGYRKIAQPKGPCHPAYCLGLYEISLEGLVCLLSLGLFHSNLSPLVSRLVCAGHLINKQKIKSTATASSSLRIKSVRSGHRNRTQTMWLFSGFLSRVSRIANRWSYARISSRSS